MHTSLPLPDEQNKFDSRGLRIPKVGITNFHFFLKAMNTLAVADISLFDNCIYSQF